MSFYRVFPWIEAAKPGEVGGALYVPSQGSGRIDNPDHYAVLYTCDSPAGAIAEVFNRNPYRMHWTRRMLRPRLPGALTAIAQYELQSPNIPLYDLDDPNELIVHALRPSSVVSRDREITQAWALALFEDRRHIGVRWWSYHDSRWGVAGFWEVRGLRVVMTQPLHIDDVWLQEAAQTLSISIDARR